MQQMLQNPWMALQDAQMPVMLQGVPYMENPAPAFNLDGSMDFSQASPAAPEMGQNYQRIMRQLEQKTVQGIGDQRKSVEQLQKYKDALLSQAGSGLDLSPLMKLADTWTGSKLSSGYEAPESTAQKLNRAMGVEQQIANQQGKITDDEIALLRQQLYGESMSQKAAKGSSKDLSAAAILKVNEGNAIPSLLEQVGQTIEANQDYLGYGAALAGTEAGRFASPANYEKSKTIDSQMRAASQAFGKYMEGGVLRKEDEEKYRKMFPSLSDTPQVARNKLAVVQNLLRQRQGSDLSALKAQGFNISGLELPGKDTALPGALTGKGQAAGKKPSFEEWKKAKGL
jgi:hypothetical protein